MLPAPPRHDVTANTVIIMLTDLYSEHIQISSVLQIRLKHQDSNCEFHFPCDKWIFMPDESVKEDIILEFPVIRPDVAPIKGSVRDNYFTV